MYNFVDCFFCFRGGVFGVRHIWILIWMSEAFVSHGGVRMLDLLFLPELFQRTGSTAADSDSFCHWDLLVSQEIARRSQSHDQASGGVSSRSDEIGMATLDTDSNTPMSVVGMARSTSGSDIVLSDDIDVDSQSMSLVSVSAESSQQLPPPRDSSLNVLIRWPDADNGGDGGGEQSVHAASNPGDALAEQAALPRLNHRTLLKELSGLDGNSLQTRLAGFSHRELVNISVMCVKKISDERSISVTLKKNIKTKNQQLRRLNIKVEKIH